MMSILVIGSVAFTWAMSTQFSKTALVINREHFYAPYTMMYFNTCFMILCYPAFLLYELISKRSWRKAHEDASSIFGRRGVHPLTLLVCVAPFLLFWIGANYTYSASLLYISPSVATSISSCNAAMVYLLAILLLGDRFVPVKLLSVAFAIAGVAVMSLDGEMRAAWQGILLSVSSAASAALYKVLFKRLMGSANLGQVSLFMSCLGFLNLAFNWVPVLILLLTDSEHIEIAYVPWGPVIGAAVLSLLFNFLINFGIALLHPLVVSVGMLMGIPLNTVIDIIFRHVPPTAAFLGGTALIIASFILIIFPYDLICRRKAEQPPERYVPHVTRMQELPDHIHEVFRRMTYGSVDHSIRGHQG
ncbi:putative membrane protein [Oesophagostomum dentatum]|uniref:Putative membrane protein n=1 Tax=Oesophagostomum dentatum TaxID=61180 RepID=A0A0B1T164_OESDE|nr:putative membrane protein [Oesophagostomum dentatum]